MVRDRRVQNSNKSIKDYLLPIVIGLSIILMVYALFFRWGDSTSENVNLENWIKLSISGENAEVYTLDSIWKKTKLEDQGMFFPWNQILVKEWDVSFDVPSQGNIALWKLWELKYLQNGNFELTSSDLFVKSITPTEINMKYIKVKVWENSVVSLNQNEVSSTVYLLDWTAEIANLAGKSWVLWKWQKISVSSKDAMNKDLDLGIMKEWFDDYFKISDWYLKNNWDLYLSKVSTSSWELNSTGSLEQSSTWTLVNKWNSLISLWNVSDESYVTSTKTNISWTYSNDSVATITFNGVSAKLDIMSKTFSIANIDTSKKENNVIVKVLDDNGNTLWKYLYTFYFVDWASQTTNNAETPEVPNSSFSQETYPVNPADFSIYSPTVDNKWDSYSDQNTIYWTVKNPNISKVTVNWYQLGSFTGKSWRYHAFTAQKTLSEWVNVYNIVYYSNDWKVLYRNVFTINKKTTKAGTVAPVTNKTPSNNTSSATPEKVEEIATDKTEEIIKSLTEWTGEWF